jgi:hypothetical protein
MMVYDEMHVPELSCALTKDILCYWLETNSKIKDGLAAEAAMRRIAQDM